MSHADKRQQVMLADRLHRDRTGDDQLVISCVVWERGQVEGRGLNISAYARAIRAGVAAKLSVSRSTPRASKNAAAACSAAIRSTPRDGLTACSAVRRSAGSEPLTRAACAETSSLTFF